MLCVSMTDIQEEQLQVEYETVLSFWKRFGVIKLLRYYVIGITVIAWFCHKNIKIN